MCLEIKKSSVAIIAEEDIECYKILKRHSGTVLEWFATWYMNTPVELNKTYYSEMCIESCGWDGCSDLITKGLHSYANLDDCIADNLNDFESRTWLIVKCYIPKGSEYYKGKFVAYSSYASNSIRYTDEILYCNNELGETIKKFDTTKKNKRRLL